MKSLVFTIAFLLSSMAFAGDCELLLMPDRLQKEYTVGESVRADIDFKITGKSSFDLSFAQDQSTPDILDGRFPDEKTISIRNKSIQGAQGSVVYITWRSGGDEMEYVNASLFEFNAEGRLIKVTLEMNTAQLHPELSHPDVRSLLTVPEEGQNLAPLVYNADVETAYLLAKRILGQDFNHVNFDAVATAEALISAAINESPVDIKEDLGFLNKN